MNQYRKPFKKLFNTFHYMRFGDIVNGVVVVNNLSFLCAQAFTNSFSKSFLDDGFCVSNKDQSIFLQSHALSFYSDTVFTIILYYMYNNVKVDPDPIHNNKLLEPIKANIVAVFSHGLGHLNLAFNSKYFSNTPLISSISNPINKNLSIVMLYFFWYYLIKAAYLNGTSGYWRVNAVIHTILLAFAVPFNHSFTYVQTILMLTAAISEYNLKNKDVYYDMKALIVHLPITIVGWIEALYCDRFLKNVGGHVIYDTTIPLSIITYHASVYYYNKYKEKLI